MAQLFDRRVRVLYAAELPGEGNYSTITTRTVQVEDLRVEFKIRKTLKKHPNTGKITITNMSAANRAFMTGKGGKVILEAGYVNGIFRIFSGDVRFCDHSHNEALWVSTIEIGDGERAFNNARVNASFAAGTPAGKLVRAFADRLGIKHGNLAQHTAKLDASRVYQHGYAAHGYVAREMDLAIKAADLEWSIQDGALQILDPQGTTGRIIVLNSGSGLIGSPQHGSPPKKGKPQVLKVKSLIQPYVPGDILDLESDTIKGHYKILEVEFTGDSRGTDWYAEMDVIPVVK